MKDSMTFLGLTKMQFLSVMAALLIGLLLMLGLQVYRNYQLADQGAQSHAALCLNRAQVTQQVADSKAFLKMTVAARVKKYGELGRIPEDTIRNSLHNQEVYLESLSILRCP